MIIFNIIAIFLIFLLGYGLCSLFLVNSEGLEKLSLSFLLGIGVFTFFWFLLNLIGIPYTLVSGFVLFLILIILTRGANKLIHKEKQKNVKTIDIAYFKKMNVIEKVSLALIVFFFLSVLIGNIYWPVRHWDSLVLYDFRAKIFAQTGFMQAAIDRGYFFGYPLLTSLAHTWAYLSGFRNPSFIYGLFYIFFVISFFTNIKKLHINRTFVLLLTLLLSIAPRLFDHTLWAYTNLPYSVYLVLGSIYLYFGFKNKDFGSFTLSALLIGLSTWTRSAEPFWLSCVIVAIVFSLMIKKWLWPAVYLAIFVPIMLPWRFFRATFQAGADVVGQVMVTVDVGGQVMVAVNDLQVSMVKTTFEFIKINVLDQYAIFFAIMVLLLLIKIISKSKNWIFAILILLNLMLVFGGTLTFVKVTPYWQEIPDSLTRMVMFIPPMVIFLMADVFSSFKLKE
jgi:hypothetical protein